MTERRAASGTAGESGSGAARAAARASERGAGADAGLGAGAAPRDETEALLRTAERCLPGGVLGRHRYPPEIADHVPVEGSGARIVDSRGRRFIDYSCGGGSLILGYGHPAVVEAVQRQAARSMQFVSIRNPLAIRLAERFTGMVRWADRVRFALSGAEAVMFALRLARAFTGREKVLKFDGAYHGNCDYGLWDAAPSAAPAPAASSDGSGLGVGADGGAGADANPGAGGPAPGSAGIPRAIRDLVRVAPYNDLEAARRIVRAEWRSLAAVIVEPVQRSYAAHPEFLAGLRELCAAHGVALVFDEVVTGFRHARGGAAEVFGVDPDLGAFGKALGGGVPISAVAGRAEVMDHADPRRGDAASGYAYVTTSQAGNPLAAAAALATLGEIARPGALEDMHASAEALKEGLRDLVRRRGLEAQVVGFGPLWDIAFSPRPIFDRRSAARADAARNLRFHVGLIRRGVMVRAGGRSYFSTAHREGEVEETLRAAECALGEL